MLSFNWNNTGVTVELGDLVDSGVDIWAFDYPVPKDTVEYNGKTAKVPFDKATFEQKILDHYRFRQIGQETVGRWLHYFRTRIREIMPYYVQLYEFEAKWFNVDDPLESYTLLETYEAENNGKTTTGGSVRFSDTPQGSIDNLDNYLTTATKNDDTTDTEGGSSYTMTRRGNIGVQPLGSEVKNIREAFINIDLMVINELKDLFLQVY